MVDFSKFDSLVSLTDYFKTEEKCVRFLERERWYGDAVCPYCGKPHAYKRSDGRYICPHCNCSFSVLVGTIFENTKVPLRKWFMAMYLLSSHKKGISSHQLSRDIEVTQKTAWFMLHKIRTLFVQESEMMDGIVECDETYIGGKETNKHDSKKTLNTQGRSLKTKTAVFGIASRYGNVVAQKVSDAKGTTLLPVIRKNVKEGSRVFTDEFIGYNTLNNSEFKHEFIQHKIREFAVGDVNTNTIEGFWGQLKRMIFGVYHFVSAHYLQRYVDESVFRYNSRKMTEGERFQRMFTFVLKSSVDYWEVKSMAA